MPQYNIKQVKGSTQGSVLFLSPNGSISENNLQLFWSSTQSSLSIGTSSATSKLSVVAQSNVPALSLGTSVASDVIMYFYTNNSTNNRAKVYVDNTLQTFNLYTQNNDTIFWNGNGLAQTKTLTLFTDTSAKFENNLQVAGNLLVNGSFSVLGSASVINTQNLTIQDPIILLASTQSGTPTLDSGFFINRGTGATQAFIWDESDSKFVFIQTNDASNAIGNVNINTGAQIRALRYNFFDSGSPAAAASATINAPSGGSIALNAAASVQFITPQLASSNQVTSWDIGANTLEFGGSNTRSFKLGIADGGGGIPTFMFYSTSAGSSGSSRTGMSFSHVIGSQLNNVLERGFVIETRDGGTYSGTAVGLTIDVTGVTNSNRFKYGLRIVDGNQSNGYVLVSDVNGFSSWTSSSVVLANANGATGSGTTNYGARWVTSTQLGTGSIYDSGTAVGIATQSNGAYALNVLGDVNILGTLYATSKSFEITHPLDSTKRLTYGSLEGPEYGVYYRGRLNNESVINLPDYWTVLIDESSITISLTPFGIYQNLFVEKVENNKVYIGSGNSGLASCYYVVYAERKDIPKIVIEK